MLKKPDRPFFPFRREGGKQGSRDGIKTAIAIKGAGAGNFAFNFTDGGIVVGTTYDLLNFTGTTGFNASDFTPVVRVLPIVLRVPPPNPSMPLPVIPLVPPACRVPPVRL